MPRPDSRIARTGQHPVKVIGKVADLKQFAREQTRRELQELEETMRVNHDPAMERPHYKTFDDAAKTLGLDAEKTRKASHLIGEVCKDVRAMVRVSKAAKEAGLPTYVIPELIRRGVQMRDTLHKGPKIVLPKKKGDPKESWSPKDDKPGLAKVQAKDKAIKEGKQPKGGPDGADGRGPSASAKGEEGPPGKGKPFPAGKGKPGQDDDGKAGPEDQAPENVDLDHDGKDDIQIGEAGDTDIGDEPPKGPPHPDIAERFEGIKKEAAKHGIKVRARGEGLHDQHTHEHLDALEHTISQRMMERFPGAQRHQARLEGALPGEEQPPMGQGAPGAGVGPADIAEPADPNAPPGPAGAPAMGAAPGGAAGSGAPTPPGALPSTPPGAMPSDLAAKQMQQQIFTIKQKLDAVQMRLDSPHAKQMFDELQSDLQNAMKQPDKQVIAWVEQRIDSFIQMLTGQSMQPPPGAPPGGGAKGAQAGPGKPGGFQAGPKPGGPPVPAKGPQLGLPKGSAGAAPKPPAPPGAKPPMAPGAKPPMAAPPVPAAPAAPAGAAPPVGKPKPAFGKSEGFVFDPRTGDFMLKAKYTRRTGGPGNYRYYYDDHQGGKKGKLEPVEPGHQIGEHKGQPVFAKPIEAKRKIKGAEWHKLQGRDRWTQWMPRYGGGEYGVTNLTDAQLDRHEAGESLSDIVRFPNGKPTAQHKEAHELAANALAGGKSGEASLAKLKEMAKPTPKKIKHNWNDYPDENQLFKKAKAPPPPPKRRRLDVANMLRKAFQEPVLVQTMEDGKISLIGDLRKAGVPEYMLTEGPMSTAIDYDAAIALHTRLTVN